jgi:hypothetical protein
MFFLYTYSVLQYVFSIYIFSFTTCLFHIHSQSCDLSLRLSVKLRNIFCSLCLFRFAIFIGVLFSFVIFMCLIQFCDIFCVLRLFGFAILLCVLYTYSVLQYLDVSYSVLWYFCVLRLLSFALFLEDLYIHIQFCDCPLSL